jgi:putative transposase
LLKAKHAFGFLMYHYVLMPNHVHLLIKPEDGKFSSCMHQIQTSYAKFFCKKYGSVGHVWQNRFKSLSIETDSYLIACGNYIEMNPLRAGIVSQPDEWRWSSCRFYVRGETNLLLNTDPLYESLGKNEEDRRIIYKQLLPNTRVSAK